MIVTGETGSGKSTQLPKICLAAGRGTKGRIVCTQPRRLAAISVAKRVAQELRDSSFGKDVVGYKIRFHDKTSRATKIKFVTDGMLLAEMQSDRFLYAYDTVILDEAHERSLNIDLLAGMLKRLLARRKDLKLVITSATMEVEKFERFFDNPPVVEVEGRTYPVEVIHVDPLTMGRGRKNDLQEQVKWAVKKIRTTDRSGDILVFLPTERDILETKNILAGCLQEECSILPLFARLSSRDQARIFSPSPKQKIILATNIAETSITVPGIRYVVDSGLARISSYNVNTHTKALPITKISKASADQRTGRAGRIESGLCLRLYSIEDYLCRPDFTPPEILRCNLAEVILRLLYLGQGPVDIFPFVDSPQKSAIREGIHTLKELGAMDSGERLTGLGKKMARLPLDPRLSRMLIQAVRQGCLREMLIIASALSIQDPRQRPVEKEAEATAAHGMFQDESSDFITWINLWDLWISMKKRGFGNNALRRFCRQHFLSFPRMREWEDIFDQLLSTLNDIKISKQKIDKKLFKSITAKPDQPLRDAIHRCVLSGFLGNIAFKKETNIYTGAKGKELAIFPGSSLFRKGPQWIVSAEQIRTSRLYARTVAPIQPEWIEEFGRPLCKYSYLEPRWSSSRGEAICTEKVTLYGLTIISGRPVSLKRVEPELARRLLISEGLAACALKNRFGFNEHNREVLNRLKDIEERTRNIGSLIDQEALEEFFMRGLFRLEKDSGMEIRDETDLRKAIKAMAGRDHYLRLQEDKLFEHDRKQTANLLYPGHIEISGNDLPLTYRFCPGMEEDGISIGIPLALIGEIDTTVLEWMVPGFLEEKVKFILRHLPKNIRANIFDYDKMASQICNNITGKTGSFRDILVEELSTILHTKLTYKDLAQVPELPPHLRMRVEILDEKNQVIEASRDISYLKEKYLEHSRDKLLGLPCWERACASWEKRMDTTDLDKIPKVIDVGMVNGIRIRAYPAIVPGDGKGNEVWLRLFPSREKALEKSRSGLQCLLQRELRQEISFINKEVKKMLQDVLSRRPHIRAMWPRYLLAPEQLEVNILELVCSRCFGTWDKLPSCLEFQERARQIRQTLVRECHTIVSHIHRVVSTLESYLGERIKIDQRPLPGGYGTRVLSQIDQLTKLLVDERFPMDRDLEFIIQMPRFVRALETRIQRALENPARDLEKQKRFQQFLPVLERIRQKDIPPHGADMKNLQELELCIWEFMVVIFAPELAVRGKASLKKINNLLNTLQYPLINNPQSSD